MSLSVQLEDSQPSDAPDEQSLPNYMQRPLAIAPIVPGQTVHAHASDKPKRPSYSTALYSPSEMALKVQLKANKEHQKKLKVKSKNRLAFNFSSWKKCVFLYMKATRTFVNA